MSLLGALTVAQPAAADPQFPTWDQVQQAKNDAASAQAEYQKIASLVTVLQQQAAQASADYLQKEVAYTEAQDALDAATTKAQDLETKATAAQQASQAATRQYGAVVSQFYLTGGSGITTQLLFQPGDASQLLQKLGTMSQLTDHTSQLHAVAEQKANLASSLSAQAKDAEATRQGLAADAQAKEQAAQAAEQKAEQALNYQQQQSQVLYAQAATLQNTEASVEQQYFEGVAYRAAMAAQEAANGDAQRLYVLSQQIHPDPAAAKAYAQSQLGAHGWGGDQWGCLSQLWTIESGWRVNAYNTSSAAYGIPQALPAAKMASYGSDWISNYVPQINWGMDYIKSRYGTPCGALSFETSHTPYWY